MNAALVGPIDRHCSMAAGVLLLDALLNCGDLSGGSGARAHDAVLNRRGSHATLSVISGNYSSSVRSAPPTSDARLTVTIFQYLNYPAIPRVSVIFRDLPTYLALLLSINSNQLSSIYYPYTSKMGLANGMQSRTKNPPRCCC